MAAGATVADTGIVNGSVASDSLEFVWAVVEFDTENQVVDIDHMSVASAMVYLKAAQSVHNNLGTAYPEVPLLAAGVAPQVW